MEVKYIDLFCGIGGFRLGVEVGLAAMGVKSHCVFSSDIDPDAQFGYSENFGQTPHGDINLIKSSEIPDHQLLVAGFPCQPFSIMGDSRGFEDTRGTLFFEIARILDQKRPHAFILENVKQLAGHDKGKTLRQILGALDDLGYFHSHKILNALDFGLPQKRERIIIVGFRDKRPFHWPAAQIPMTPLGEILEKDAAERYYASKDIQLKRLKHHEQTDNPTVWHENKSGHISVHDYSCALRAGASYNYLLVNGERRLTEREMLRLQGFPDTFRIVTSYNKLRRQTGNAVPVPMISAVAQAVCDAMNWSRTQ